MNADCDFTGAAHAFDFDNKRRGFNFSRMGVPKIGVSDKAAEV